MTALAASSITAAQLATPSIVTRRRGFVRCGACQAASAYVVGREGREVFECFSCGRRQAVRAEHRRDRAPSRIP